jgi:hypothetical protein
MARGGRSQRNGRGRGRTSWSERPHKEDRAGLRGGKKTVEVSKYVLEYQERQKNGMSSERKCGLVDHKIKKKIPIAPTLSEGLGTEDNELMMSMLGFAGFGSTKGRPVEDNHTGAAKGAARIEKKKKREYRQYMNRKSGGTLLDGGR